MFIIKQGSSSWQISSSEWEKDWEHQCALISHNMLSKTNTVYFYMKIHAAIFFWMTVLFFVGFWIKFKSKKLFFGLTWKIMFFSIQYLNNLQFTKTFADNMSVLSLKKERQNGCKSIFHEYDKKKQLNIFTKRKVQFVQRCYFWPFLTE